MKLMGSQIVAKALKANGVDYVAGMPGDGLRALVEALLTTGTDIPFIHVIQEQSAVHLADGYFRACGRPMAVLLAVPLGISKALGAIAVALSDASAMLVISGADTEGEHDRSESTATGITKEHLRVASIEQLPLTLRKSFETMFSGRIGPVSLHIPAAVQSTSVDAGLSPATLRAHSELQRADSRSVERAASPLFGAAHPVIAKEPALHLIEKSASDVPPLMLHRSLAELKAVLDRDAIVVVGAGSLQAMVRDMFPVDQPRGLLCATSVDVVGWAVPAAIGAKLAVPARQVVCVVGAGDFLQSMQEMAVCVMHSFPVVFLVFNDSGAESLNDGQDSLVEQHRAGEFKLPDGKPYSPDFAGIARSFGVDAWRVEHASQLHPAFLRALNSTGPSLVEVITACGFRVS